MITLTLVVTVVTAFLLAFASLRWIGLLGVAFLIYLFPLVAVMLLVLGAAAYYFFNLK